MDLLKAALDNKRKSLESKELIGSEKKYFKREELIKKEEEEYWQKSYQQSRLPVNNENQFTNKGLCLSSKLDDIDVNMLPRKEVIKRLRERGEPILLFGESLSEAFLRLKQLEVSESETNRGFRNDFQEAMEKLEQEYLNEMLKAKASGDESKQKGNDVKVEEINTSIEELSNLAVNLGKKKDDISQDCKIICNFLKFLLELWGKNLNSRLDKDKTSTQGKKDSATYTQTQTYLKPLFKQLDGNKVAEDILKHLILIVKFLLERDYVKASDAYLQMAIGNSPWPIGVTMVGIHARTGREKIFSQNIAHVLNDETQRKYIQGLKRLITRCQKFFPTDPSRCVEYNA